MSAKPTTKSASSRAPRKPSAKPVRKSTRTSLLSNGEVQNLVLQAKEAFAYQTALGNIKTGTNDDAWRRDQVMASVGKAGTSKINRDDWKSVKAHFLTLSGREDEALELLTETGVKSYRPVDGADTWETCEQFTAIVREKLADHRKAVAAHEKGHLHEGWFLAAARQRTGKPTLTMDTLAERLDPRTLHGLLAHLRNHIALREGRAVPERRSKRVYPKRPTAADAGEMDDPF